MTETTIESTLVRLRRAEDADSALLQEWDASPDAQGEFNDFGPQPSSNTHPSSQQTVAGDTNGRMIVERMTDSRPVGSVSWRKVGHGPGSQSQAWQLGIALTPEGRGQGLGAEALRLVAEYLFATTSAHRIEAECDVDNTAARRAVEKAGLRFEGILRGAQYRAGAYHDIACYGRVRGD